MHPLLFEENDPNHPLQDERTYVSFMTSHKHTGRAPSKQASSETNWFLYFAEIDE